MEDDPDPERSLLSLHHVHLPKPAEATVSRTTPTGGASATGDRSVARPGASPAGDADDAA